MHMFFWLGVRPGALHESAQLLVKFGDKTKCMGLVQLDCVSVVKIMHAVSDFEKFQVQNVVVAVRGSGGVGGSRACVYVRC